MVRIRDIRIDSTAFQPLRLIPTIYNKYNKMETIGSFHANAYLKANLNVDHNFVVMLKGCPSDMTFMKMYEGCLQHENFMMVYVDPVLTESTRSLLWALHATVLPALRFEGVMYNGVCAFRWAELRTRELCEEFANGTIIHNLARSI